ncbi:gentisate 1%2C2-dioxygenase [Bordetella ansorpii]|uniref:Gentisate 1,2-dioxygenase n=2 Tax=Bordetella ansorpii TaxID=288768 RepID=A0A157SX00_9BORD|nr:gentisate 1%2C2-dioxygenase [Bordetella ansorpii]
MSEETSMQDARARQNLKAELAKFNCKVHQPDDPPVFTREPKSSTQTVHWRWADLQPLLQRLGSELDIGSGGQRRTLRLANPGLPYGTTHTFWASIQVILPGEIAAAHRHTANAFRFIMKGGGATTTVDGERYVMNEGDLVLTPSMCWHDHEYHGDQPIVWLDILDVAVMQMLHASFFEPHASEQQAVLPVPDRSERLFGNALMMPPAVVPTGATANPLLVYPRALALESLDRIAVLGSDPADDLIQEYRNPVTGGPAMQTMDMRLQRLRAGFQGVARRHTGSKLYYVVEGAGRTVVEGVAYDWRAGDFLTINPWAWHSHANLGGSDALLFQVNDFPVMQKLGYYREEIADEPVSVSKSN